MGTPDHDRPAADASLAPSEERDEAVLWDELDARGEVVPIGEGVEGEILDLDPGADPELKADLAAALAEADEDARAGRFLTREQVMPRARLAG